MGARLNNVRLSLNLRPSLVYCVVIFLVHLIPLIGIYLTQLEFYYQLAFSLALMASFGYWINRYGFLRHPLSVIAVNFVRERWFLSLRSGEKIEVQLESPIVVLSFAIILNFRDACHRKFPMTILSGTVSPEEARRSRVFLLWGHYQTKQQQRVSS